jgi:hypothetical protein
MSNDRLRALEAAERYEEYDDLAPGVRQPKSQGKQRVQGALTNLAVYGRNRQAGAQNRLDRLNRRLGR